MTQLDLALLGPPVITRGGTPVSFDTRKATAVLALLAAGQHERQHELSRERLAALLWPDVDSARARASLRRTLSVTAAAAGPGLLVGRGTVALDLGQVRVDVTEFETLAAGPDAAALERAAGLYRDDFLAGFALRGCPEFDDWQAATADRLRQRLAGALERLAAACTAAGDLDRATGHTRRWLALDPLHEPAHQALIRLLAWTGQRSAALRAYRALVRILDTELAVRPLPETTQLYDDVRAGRLAAPPRATPAATRAGQAAPHPAPPQAVGSAAREGRSVAQVVPLVGRAAELQALHRAWREAGAAGQVAAVLGPAGCGKTRLVEEFRQDAQAAGAVLLAARCHDGESGLAFVLAADLLAVALSVCPELPARLPAHTAAMTGRLCPGLAADYPDDVAPLDSPMALTRLYAAIGEALRAAASPGPGGAAGPAGVVLVEDVHWADGPSLDLLGYLVRRLAGWPLLLVLSWSTDHAERLRGLRSALGEASDAGRCTLIEPAPLAADQIRELLDRSGVSDADVGRLLAQTRGLPMLVREYVEGLRSGAGQPGAAGETGERWWPPASVRQLLRRRLQAASEPTQQMLSTAAVLGSGCDADLLRAVSGRGEAETVEALDEAVRRFLITEVPPAGEHGQPSYEFPYEALREVVYESATLARRRLLHGRAADTLARRYERDPLATRAAAVAEHLQRAGRDAEAAVWWWRAAARARDLYAHAEEYAHLRQAEALGYPAIEVAVALGDAATMLGRYHEALAEFEAAAAAGGDAPGSVGADIEHKLAEVHHRLGDWALAEAHLAAAAQLLDPADTSRRARIEADRAVLGYRRGATAGAARLAARALAAARAAGDPAAVAQALNVLGMLAARRGDTATAAAQLRESLAQARQLPDRGAAVAALNNLARLLAESGHPAEALPLAQEALALGRELGDQHRVAALHTNLADLLHAAGQRDAALVHLKEAARGFAAVDTGGTPRPEVWTLVEW
ncbi:MAG TPA: BTAD domain-containing putative transcriptional regulator [Streptosporangiaceae bacterium]|nr:BTAD domain-containing putative transcriptional regulator [Streptosporangiaceae bacterium]